ncbi:type II secretion system protein J [Chloroflexota bacterium]
MFLKSMFNIRNEGGYSLIGIVISLAIMTIITTGIMMTIDQIYNVSSGSTNHIIAIREVQNAGHWLTLDGQKAVTMEPAQDPDGFPLTISWDDPADNQHEVVYTLSPDNKLQRQHYTNRTINPDPDTTTLIALYIDLSNTSCHVSDGNELVANITASVNIDRVSYTETRTYRILPRGSLR